MHFAYVYYCLLVILKVVLWLQKLNKSADLVNANYGKLKEESDRLETHVKRACSSWILVLLVVVVMTFIWMVLFMKMFPKK